MQKQGSFTVGVFKAFMNRRALLSLHSRPEDLATSPCLAPAYGANIFITLYKEPCCEKFCAGGDG